MAEINFARGQQEQLLKTRKKDLLIARYTMTGLAVFGVVLAIVLVFRIFFTLKVQSLRETVISMENRLTQVSALERQYLVYARKIQLLFGLEESRRIKQEAVAFFYTLIPNDHTLLSVRIDGESESIVFQVESPDVFRLLAMLEGVRDRLDATESTTYKLKISNLNRDPSAKYTVNGTLTYGRQE